jgi:nucleoside-diphosphate-sugar epimerase
MKALVTGGSGFIGSNLTRALLRENYEVGLLLREGHIAWRIDEIRKDVELLNADLTDKDRVKQVVRDFNPDVIFHLATFGAYPSREKDLDLIVKTNILGTISLLNASGDIPLINTGSSSEYGIKSAPMREDDLCTPNIDYGWAKLAQTIYCQTRRIPTLRIFSAYGPWEDPNRLIPTLIKSKIDGNDLNLIDSVRDFVYIDDVIDAFLKTSRNYERARSQIINVGTGRQRSVKDLLSVLDSINPRKIPINWNFKQVQTEPSLWVADIRKAGELIGWTPRYTLEQGLEKTYKWWQAAAMQT